MSSGSFDEYRFLAQPDWDCTVLDLHAPAGLSTRQARIITSEPHGIVAAEAVRRFVEMHGSFARGEATLRVRNSHGTLDFAVLVRFGTKETQYLSAFLAWRGSVEP